MVVRSPSGPTTKSSTRSTRRLPRGDNFTQYSIAVADGGTFGFSFWLHNTGSFPVTVTGVGDARNFAFGTNVVDVRMGRASGTGTPASTLPFTIPPHAYAAVAVQARFNGCLDESTSTDFGTLPVSFDMFGFVQRETQIVMPMTIRLVGPTGAQCTP